MRVLKEVCGTTPPSFFLQRVKELEDIVEDRDKTVAELRKALKRVGDHISKPIKKELPRPSTIVVSRI